MAVREFNPAATDLIACSVGSLGAICNGAYSIIGIVKPLTATANGKAYMGIQVGTSSLLSSFGENSSARQAVYTDAEQADAITNVDTSWQILALSRASGTSTVAFSRKALGTGTWTHASSSQTVANNATTADRIEFGGFLAGGFGSSKDCRIATIAVYNTALSDATIESVQTTPSTQQLADLGAVALWDFNQASTGTALADLVGTANQTAISGTSVVTTDDPTGWTFGLSGGGGGVAGQGPPYEFNWT